MATPSHPWNSVCRQTGRRFAFGLLTALSLTLVAFEWRGGEAMRLHDDDDWIEDPYIPKVLPPVIIERTVVELKQKAKRSGGPLVSGDPDPVVVEPEIDEPSTEGPGTPDPEPGPVDPEPGPTETTTSPGPMTWKMVGIRPHFMDCMKRGMEHVDECTETRIGKHLERRFRVPPGIRGTVRTTITFEINAEGKIGRLVCTPRVDPSVEAEIERVIRSLPEFVPGSQGGHAVPVYYQIPLSVRTV